MGTLYSYLYVNYNIYYLDKCIEFQDRRRFSTIAARMTTSIIRK